MRRLQLQETSARCERHPDYVEKVQQTFGNVIWRAISNRSRVDFLGVNFVRFDFLLLILPIRSTIGERVERMAKKQKQDWRQNPRPKRHMSKRIEALANGPIQPDRFYRWKVVELILMASGPMLRAKIRSGELPEPVRLWEGGRACGYWGSQILQIKAQTMKVA